MKRTLGCLGALSFFLSACAQHGALPATPGSDAPAGMRAKGAYRVVYSFGLAPDGTFPAGPLVNVRGTLYGITSTGGSQNGGTLFSVDSSGKERTLHSFPGYTASYGGPPSEPSTLTTQGGKLYGVTTYGGSGGCTDRGVRIGCGTLFRYSPGGGVRTIYNFTSASAFPLALTSANGVLYVATGLVVYSSTPSGKIHLVSRFSSYTAVSGLLIVGNTLYGTQSGRYGSANNDGAVFALTLSGQMKTIYTFKGGSDGQGPTGELAYIGGVLYGVTQGGGTGKCQPYNPPPAQIGCGTVYSVTPSGTERVLFSFTGTSDGSFPVAGLTSVRGVLYGTTSGSGYPGTSEGNSSIFRITPAGALTVLHTWSPAENPIPEGGVAQLGSSLFSTTSSGGKLRRGTIFSVTP